MAGERVDGGSLGLAKARLETREVAELASISKATLTGVVKTLERDGLLQRRPVEGDRRLVFLDLTDAGRELLERLWFALKAADIVIAYPQLDVHLDKAVIEALRER